jgi:hypothetical protein
MEDLLGLTLVFGCFLLLWTALYVVIKQAENLVQNRIERYKLRRTPERRNCAPSNPSSTPTSSSTPSTRSSR